MRYLMLVSVLLLGVSWAVAQSDTNQTSPSQSTPSTQTSPDQATPTQAGNGNAGATTVEGCLSGSDGSYTLTDKNGTSYQLTGDTAKLSEHVGHEIKVTGSTTTGSGSAGAAAGASAGASGGSSQQALSVSSIKHVSKTCQK